MSCSFQSAFVLVCVLSSILWSSNCDTKPGVMLTSPLLCVVLKFDSSPLHFAKQRVSYETLTKLISRLLFNTTLTPAWVCSSTNLYTPDLTDSDSSSDRSSLKLKANAVTCPIFQHFSLLFCHLLQLTSPKYSNPKPHKSSILSKDKLAKLMTTNL